MDCAAAGLGLQYGSVRLVRADPTWTDVAQALAASIVAALPDVVAAVEHVGSTAVPGLLAKPVLDFAVGVRAGVDVGSLIGPMGQLGWIFRGDAGNDGGYVFVLEDAPRHRVAHAHGVEFGGEQWQRYLRFRDVLRSSAPARRAYEESKQRLADQHPDDRRAYTSGKTSTVQRLLRGSG